MIYVSTGGFKELNCSESINLFLKNGIKNIELSGGKFIENPYDIIRNYLKNSKIQLHNYFPPAKNPFVLNFCSMNQDTIENSKQIIKKNIEFTKEIGQKYVSFHAGFLVDLKAQDLGKSKKKFEVMEKKKGLNNFLKHVEDLSIYAEKYNVEILIENNVIGKSNYNLFEKNPFLMTTVDEMVEMMDLTPNNINLLLDVGHLKVSSQILGFDKFDVFKKCSKWIKGLHISDNDGYEDNNQPIKKSSWFNNKLPKVDFYTLEVYSKNLDLIKKQIKILEDMIIKNEH